MQRSAVLVFLAAFVALAAVASLAGAASSPGGALRVDLTFNAIDPSLGVPGDLNYATQLQLYNYPDVEGDAGARLVPEAAAGPPRVSSDGRTYTFTVKRGFRFSNGAPVTAANFAFGIDRALNPAEEADYATTILNHEVIRVRPRGQTLTVRLARPDPSFVARLSVGTFAALPLGLPIDPHGVSTAPLASAGPYYVKQFVPNNLLVLARNPYWKRALDPGRPARVGEIDFLGGFSQGESVERIAKGQTDVIGGANSEWGIVNTFAPQLAATYGVNKRQFFVVPWVGVRYLSLNYRRPLFRDNPQLVKALNFAIDRPEILRQFGPFAGTETDEILPPGIPGHGSIALYPLKGAEVAKARRLARGHTRSGTAVMYTPGVPQDRAVAAVVAYNLKQIGISVTVKQFDGPVMFERMRNSKEPWDIAFGGWFADFPDASDFINLDGLGFLSPINSTDIPELRREITAASRTTGPARATAYARLDFDLMREGAPIVPIFDVTVTELVGARVGCIVRQAYWGSLDLVALCKT